MMMADSLKMATLLPLAAIRVIRPAEPLSCVDMDEKVSLCQESVSDRFRDRGQVRKTLTVESITSCARALS